MIDFEIIKFKYYDSLDLKGCTMVICDDAIYYHSIFPLLVEGKEFVKFYHNEYWICVVKLRGGMFGKNVFNVVLHDETKGQYFNPINIIKCYKNNLLETIQETINMADRRFVQLSSFL